MKQCPYCFKFTDNACCNESEAHLVELRQYDIFKDGSCDAYSEDAGDIISVVVKETAPEVIKPHYGDRPVNPHKLWVPNE